MVISHDKILTAAHCLFNYRSQRFVPADELHFMLGYRTRHYSAHARIPRYEIGAGFDPLRYDETSDADWAVLTVTKSLPASVELCGCAAMRRRAGPGRSSPATRRIAPSP